MAAPLGVDNGQTDHAVAVDDRVEGKGVLQDLDVGSLSNGSGERPHDLCPGCITVGVHDPVERVACLASELQLTPPPVERGSQIGEPLDTVDRTRGDLSCNSPVPHATRYCEGVGHVLLDRVVRAECDSEPTLRETRGACPEEGLGHDSAVAEM